MTISRGLANAVNAKVPQALLRKLSNSYSRIYQEQTLPDFWGLRDFYSLIKSVSKVYLQQRELKYADLSLLVGRHFNGRGQSLYVENLKKFSKETGVTGSTGPMPAIDLIRSNQSDSQARHLMVKVQLHSLNNVGGN